MSSGVSLGSNNNRLWIRIAFVGRLTQFFLLQYLSFAISQICELLRPDMRLNDKEGHKRRNQ